MSLFPSGRFFLSSHRQVLLQKGNKFVSFPLWAIMEGGWRNGKIETEKLMVTDFHSQ